MENYSMIVEEIESYNNIADMKNKFDNFIRKFENYQLEEFKEEILNKKDKHKEECKEEDCSYLERYNYGIKRIDALIGNNIENFKKKSININNNIINGDNNNINSNNHKSNLPEKNIYSKYWWGFVIPFIVGILIWYFTK